MCFFEDKGKGVWAGRDENSAGAGKTQVCLDHSLSLSLYSEHSRYEEMLGLKLGLDTEIAVYRALLDTEEKRVTRWCRFWISSVLHSYCFSNNLLENGDSVPNGKKSDTESEEEGDGIFEKIKKKVEDIIDWLIEFITQLMIVMIKNFSMVPVGCYKGHFPHQMDIDILCFKQDSWDQLQLLQNHSFRLSLSPQLQRR